MRLETPQEREMRVALHEEKNRTIIAEANHAKTMEALRYAVTWLAAASRACSKDPASPVYHAQPGEGRGMAWLRDRAGLTIEEADHRRPIEEVLAEADARYGRTVEVIFAPQEWLDDLAMPAKPLGRTAWKVAPSRIKDLRMGTHESDALRECDNAPEWCRDWSGPFEITWDEDELAEALAALEKKSVS